MLKEVKIELTQRCLRDCKHCSSSASNNQNNFLELSYQDVKKVIKEAKDMNVESVVFTGGEPLMYNKLDSLIKYTKNLGIKSSIYTFGYRTDETLKKYQNLIDSGLNKIVYSLADTLSSQKDISKYNKQEFFDKVFKNKKAKLGFHYTLSKDSFSNFKNVVNNTINTFKDKNYFDKISILRFVPHGRGTIEMDLTKEQYKEVKEFYTNFPYKAKLRLGSPWNILGIYNNPCIIADEIMIIGFDGIAYPCDSIKYFNELGTSGNIKKNSLSEMYNSPYFQKIRALNKENTCVSCNNYALCKSGCIGQKIIANVNDCKTLEKCLNKKDPKCLIN